MALDITSTIHANTVAMLQPVFALALLTLCITILMYFKRVSAMKELRIHPQKAQNTRDLVALLPQSVNRVSNNYNHLFEQPTLFYVVCLAIALLEHVNDFFIAAAWLFVFLRIIHSVIQVTIDKVMLRFLVFIASWVVLGAMIVYETTLLFLS